MLGLRAATRVNALNGREKRQHKKYCDLQDSASSRNLQKIIVLNAHGRGRWFESSIAHSLKGHCLQDFRSAKD
jgi:hypothetical protein